MKHFNKLTPAETERLSILSEECAEVIQIIGKIMRHGYESSHPNGGPCNRELLEVEFGHVLCAKRMMVISSDLNDDSINNSLDEKREKIKPYLHHQ